MNQTVNFRRALAGGLLLASALTCDAMSLGRIRGVVWIGQPLDVNVPVRLEPGEDVAAVCVAADILYADSRVNGSQVRVYAEPGNTRDEATVRIRSTVPVDEPVVNIYLKVGCGQAMTRKYVLLTEVPVDYTAQSEAPRSRALLAPSVRAANDRFDGAGATSGRVAAPPVEGGIGVRVPGRGSSASPTEPMAAVSRKPAGPAAATRPASGPAPVRSIVRKPETAAGKSRLRLDPADLLLERDPVLRASMDLLSIPQEQDVGARRAEAAAWWRAINATPEQILGDARRIQALQADVASLRSQNQKSEAVVADLKLRVQQAQAERYANGLVYALVVAMLATLGVAGYFWNRSRKQAQERQWWGAQEDAVDSAGDLFAPDEAPDLASSGSAGGQGAAVDIDLGGGSGSMRSADAFAARPGLGVLDSGDFQTSLTGSGRAVKVEELLDVQQQADFFISLGQYDQAIATLRNHIADNVETSALAYLDLLKIYHLQKREKDYALVRKEFNDVFNAEIPEFSAFGQQTRGLQSYESAMSRITDLWPTPKVLEVIEESIFRKPGQGRQVFDLEAYRELLMLYSIAKEIVEESRPDTAIASSGSVPAAEPGQRRAGHSGVERPGFQATTIQPLPTDPLFLDPAYKVPPSANLGLDIDLSEFAPEVAKPPPMPAAAGPGTTKPADSHLIDFDIFDMATRAHAASKRGKS